MDHYDSLFPRIVGFLFRTDRWAVTIGQHTWYSCSEEYVSEWWRAHEDVHKRQWGRYGYRFIFMYLWEFMKHGYTDNRYEVEANRDRMKPWRKGV